MRCRHVATQHRHRYVALVPFRNAARRGTFFSTTEFLLPLQRASCWYFVHAYPRPHCHQEIDVLETQTTQRHNLTVDGVTINVHSLPEAVSSIVSAAKHGDNFSVCTLNLDHVVQLQQRSDFRAAYRRARFVTA